jgi:glycosyltransferase involved in cell wall biosynthesis
MYKYQFTVFTPCYNSGHTIYRVIESLKKQTFRNFEWIIVDDGTDNVFEIIHSQYGISDDDFPVKYIPRTERLGKPSAINLAVSKAEGKFFLIADADDSFADGALDFFYHSYHSTPDELKNEISGVCANCQDQYGNFIGTPFPVGDNGKLICSTLDATYKYKIQGEKWGFIKTDIMKEFPFSTADKFILESSVWFAIGNKYKTLYMNEIVRTYYRYENSERLSVHVKQNYPLGFVCYYQDIINLYIKKMYLSFFDMILLYKNLLKYTILAKIRLSKSINKLNKIHKKIFAYICIPLGFLAVYRHKKKYKNMSQKTSREQTFLN